jgi:hypothetical protein
MGKFTFYHQGLLRASIKVRLKFDGLICAVVPTTPALSFNAPISELRRYGSLRHMVAAPTRLSQASRSNWEFTPLCDH